VLSLFRTNQQLFGIFLLLYGAILRLSWWWIDSPVLPFQVGIGNTWLAQDWLTAPAVSWTLSLVCLCIQAWLVIGIFFQHRIGRHTDLLPGLGVVLLGSMLPVFLPLSSFSVANVAVLLALRSQLLTYRQSSAADLLFNTGFYLGIAGLFQPSYLLLLPFIGLSTTLIRSGRFRDQTTLLFGTFTPLFLVGFAYYWYDHFDFFWTQQWQGAFSLPQQWTMDDLPWAALIALGSLTLFVLLQAGQYRKKTKMDVQVKLKVVYWYLLGLGLTVLFAQPWHLYRWQAIVPIAGALLGLSLSQSKRPVAEVWHLLLLVLLAFLHFGV